MRTGAFVISLDFELHWGVRDSRSLDSYRANLLGVREAVPAMLELFETRGIHATWATVGFLFCRTKREIEETVPTRLPRYENVSLSPYDFATIGQDEDSDPFHYAPTLIERVMRSAGQEIATHTFSHYYCKEYGQTLEDFDADLESAHRAASRLGVTLRSIVFPRNQENPAYRSVLVRRGYRAYRSTAGRWPYTASLAAEPTIKRAARLADAYLPVVGHGFFRPHYVGTTGLVDVPSSAFLRPYGHSVRWLEPIKVERLRRAMTHAAKRGDVFHLWWHPHNFGVNLAENLATLSAIFDHFVQLRKRLGMESMTMDEASRAFAA